MYNCYCYFICFVFGYNLCLIESRYHKRWDYEEVIATVHEPVKETQIINEIQPLIEDIKPLSQALTKVNKDLENLAHHSNGLNMDSSKQKNHNHNKHHHHHRHHPHHPHHPHHTHLRHLQRYESKPFDDGRYNLPHNYGYEYHPEDKWFYGSNGHHGEKEMEQELEKAYKKSMKVLENESSNIKSTDNRKNVKTTDN